MMPLPQTAELLESLSPESSRYKLLRFADADTFKEFDMDIRLNINDEIYDKELTQIRKNTVERESVITGSIKINNKKCFVCVFEPLFLNGSIGVVAAQKIDRLFMRASKAKKPVIMFISSYGSRSQEEQNMLPALFKAIISIRYFTQKRNLFIACITGPVRGLATRLIQESICNILINEATEGEWNQTYNYPIDIQIRAEQIKDTLSILL